MGNKINTSRVWLYWLLAVMLVIVLLAAALIFFAQVSALQTILNREPDYEPAELYRRAMAQSDQGSYVEAEAYLESALAKINDNAYRGQLAVVKYRLKKYAEAETQYKLLIEAGQDLPFSWNGLGNTYRDWAQAENNDSVLADKALAAYAAAISADSGYIAAYSNQAMFLNDLGRAAEAQIIIDQGIQATGSQYLSSLKSVLGFDK